jgi:hypothetical protein
MTTRRIEIDMPDALYFEGKAAAALKPGHIVDMTSAATTPMTVQKANVQGARSELFVALEDALQGNGVTDAYATDDIVGLKQARRGHKFYGRLPANAVAVARGDKLMSNGDGTFVLWPSTGSKLYTNAAASTAVSNTVSTEQDYSLTYTVPANLLKVGDVLNIRGHIVVSAAASTDTITVKVYLGATALVTTAAVDAATGDIITFNIDVVIRTIGATGTYVAWNHNANGVPATGTVKAGFVASTAIDTTATNVIKASSTWSATTATCTSAVQSLIVTLDRGTGLEPLVVADEAVDNSAVAEEAFIAVRAL